MYKLDNEIIPEDNAGKIIRQFTMGQKCRFVDDEITKLPQSGCWKRLYQGLLRFKKREICTIISTTFHLMINHKDHNRKLFGKRELQY